MLVVIRLQADLYGLTHHLAVVRLGILQAGVLASGVVPGGSPQRPLGLRIAAQGVTIVNFDSFIERAIKSF